MRRISRGRRTDALLEPNVRATAVASSQTAATPAVCQSDFTLAVGETADYRSRNALQFPASTTVRVDVASAWPYGGRFERHVYRALALPGQRHGSARCRLGECGRHGDDPHDHQDATQLWATDNLRITAAMAGGLSSGADIELRTGTGADMLHRIEIEGGALVAAPTATPIPSRTPTRTDYADLHAHVNGYGDADANDHIDADSDAHADTDQTRRRRLARLPTRRPAR